MEKVKRRGEKWQIFDKYVFVNMLQLLQSYFILTRCVYRRNYCCIACIFVTLCKYHRDFCFISHFSQAISIKLCIWSIYRLYSEYIMSTDDESSQFAILSIFCINIYKRISYKREFGEIFSHTPIAYNRLIRSLDCDFAYFDFTWVRNSLQYLRVFKKIYNVCVRAVQQPHTSF